VSVSILSEGITTVFLFTIDEVVGFQFLTRRAQLFSSQNNGLQPTLQWISAAAALHCTARAVAAR
jgi:hypothetical protein